MPIKRLRVDANKLDDLTWRKTKLNRYSVASIYIDLIFQQIPVNNSENDDDDDDATLNIELLKFDPVELINHQNKFEINSNNLLNLFDNGNEFI